MKFKSLGKVIVVNAGLLLVGIIIIEAIFGSWLKPTNLNQLNITRNARVVFRLNGLYEWQSPEISYVLDKNGLRGSFGDPSEIGVLTVGGSTTGQGYISDGYTWQDVVQQSFARNGRKVVFANAGLDGHSTYGHIKNFDLWYPKIEGLRPRHILYYVGINDFFRDQGSRWDDLSREHKDSISELILELKERSAVYYLLRVVNGVFLSRYVYKISHRKIDFGKVRWTPTPLLKDHDKVVESMVRPYRRRLHKLIDRTVAFGATPIFVTQPMRKYKKVGDRVVGARQVATLRLDGGRKRVGFNGLDYFHMMNVLNGVTLKVCRERKAICIPLAEDLAFSWEDSDFYDFWHMTPKGARKVGEYLYRQLRGRI